MTTNFIFKIMLVFCCCFNLNLTAQTFECKQEILRVGNEMQSASAAELAPWKTANDIIVEQGKNFTLQSIKTYILSWDPIIKTKVTIFQDVDGLPGNTVFEQDNIVPQAENIGFDGSLNIFEVTFDINPVTLEGSTQSETRYWVQLEFKNSDSGSFATMIQMIASTENNIGKPMIMLENTGWEYLYTIPANEPMEGLVSFYGDCEELNTQNPDCTISCPENINVQTLSGETTANVTYSVEYECDVTEGVEIVLAEGLASGSAFPIGTTTVTHNVVFDGEILETCSFDVTVEEFMNVNDLHKNSLSVYPNPVKDILNISDSKEISKIAIFDLSGKQVFTQNLNNKQAQINVSNLPTGIYIVKANVNGETKTFKIVKK